MDIKKIIKSGFFQSFISEYVDYHVSYHYGDQDRLMYALCNSNEEKDIATREEITKIRNGIKRMGYEDLSFAFLISHKDKSNEISFEKDQQNWITKFQEFFIGELTSLTPVMDEWSIIKEQMNWIGSEREFWEVVKITDKEASNVQYIIAIEEEIMNEIELRIRFYRKNDYWDFDLDFFKDYIEQSSIIERLIGLCNLLIQLFRLIIFESFLVIDQKELENEKIIPYDFLIQNHQLKYFIDPHEFMKLMKINYKFNLTKVTNYTEERKEEVYQNITIIIEQLKQIRTSISLSEDIINRNTKELSEIDNRLIKHWLLMALGINDTYVYAYNFLAKEMNKQMNMIFWPLKEIPDSYLLQLLEFENIKSNKIIDKLQLPDKSQIVEGKTKDTNAFDLKSFKRTEDTIGFLNGTEVENMHLLNLLKKDFAGEKGKDIAIMILSLEETKLIAYSENKKLFSALRIVFEIKGSDSGINKYLTDTYRNQARHMKVVSLYAEKIRKHMQNIPKLVV